MRVLFLQQQPCPRARKYGAALGAMRPDIELGFAYRGRTLSESMGNGDELFGGWWKLGERPARDLREALAEFRPDIIHSLNPPDSLTVLANDLTGTRVPVIHDIRGLESLHGTPYDDGFPQPLDTLELERRAIEESAALVAASPELLARGGRPPCAAAAHVRLPELRARAGPTGRAPRGGGSQRGAGASRLRGHPVHGRRPLRPARDLQGDRRSGTDPGHLPRARIAGVQGARALHSRTSLPRPAQPGGAPAGPAPSRLRLGGLQRRRERRAPRGSGAQQALRVRGLRAAGGHPAPSGAQPARRRAGAGDLPG